MNTESKRLIKIRLVYLCLVEARPQVQGIFLLRYAVGSAFALTSGVLETTGSVNAATLATGATGWWSAVISVYLINGVTDLAEDRANLSKRPIAAGALPGRTAEWIAGSAGVLSLVLGVTAGVEVWIAMFLIIGWVYSVPPLAAKRWSVSASAVIFGLGWMTYAGGAAAIGTGLGQAGLVFCASMSAWMALVGSFVKDLSDAGGDAIGGRRTLAARRGLSAARQVTVLTATVVGISAPVSSLLWAPAALAGTLPLAVGAGWIVAMCCWNEAFRQVSAYVRRARYGEYEIFMGTQYAANLSMLGFLSMSTVT